MKDTQTLAVNRGLRDPLDLIRKSGVSTKRVCVLFLPIVAAPPQPPTHRLFLFFSFLFFIWSAPQESGELIARNSANRNTRLIPAGPEPTF